MVDNIDLLAKNGSRSINFGFRDPGNRLPYQVKSVTGLDADEIINHFAGNSSSDSTSFNTPTLVKREVSLLLGLNPDWGINRTFSDLRDDLYRLIGSCPSGMVWIRFNYGTSEDDSHVKAVLLGRISKVEANHFVERPEVQLTITAEDYPMLQANSLTEIDDPSWVARTQVATEALHLEDLVSTAPHGLYAEFEFTASTTNFKMEGLSYLEGLNFEIDSFSFQDNDLLYLSSQPDNRYVYVKRGSTITHLVDKVTAASVWPVLYPGSNFYTWRTGTLEGTSSRAICRQIAWTSTFWGV